MKTHTMAGDPPSTRQRGTTLISLMIGLVISMIVVLATMMLFQRTSRVTGEARRDAQADAQRSAAILAASMVLQEAGYGINAAQMGTHLVVLKDAKLTGTALTGTLAKAGDTELAEAVNTDVCDTADPPAACRTAVVWAEPTTDGMRCSGLLALRDKKPADLRKLGPATCEDASNFAAVAWPSQALSNTPVTISWKAESCSSFGIAPVAQVSGAGAGAGTQKVLLTLSSRNSNGVTLETSQCLTNISVP